MCVRRINTENMAAVSRRGPASAPPLHVRLSHSPSRFSGLHPFGPAAPLAPFLCRLGGASQPRIRRIRPPRTRRSRFILPRRNEFCSRDFQICASSALLGHGAGIHSRGDKTSRVTGPARPADGVKQQRCPQAGLVTGRIPRPCESRQPPAGAQTWPAALRLDCSCN